MCTENSSISQPLRSGSIKLSFHCTKQGDFGPWFCELFTYAVSQKAEISKNFWDLTGKNKDVVKFSLYWALGFFSPPLYNPIILNEFTSYIMVAVLQYWICLFPEVIIDQLIGSSVENETSVLYQLQEFYFHESSTAPYFFVVPVFLTTLSFENANALKKGGNAQIFSCGNIFTFNNLPFNKTLRSQ